jgi:hypothetical protein
MAAGPVCTMSRPLLTLVLLTILAACAATAREPSAFAQAWVGNPAAELIADLGPPLRETTGGKGGHILVWEIQRYSPLSGAYTATREAWVGRDGVI